MVLPYGRAARQRAADDVRFVLFFLGGLASVAGSEAVLPAYLVGMMLAPTFLKDRELPHRMHVVAFAILTPFYFLKAGFSS